MGYETKIIIGRVGMSNKELEHDPAKPYADGRMEHYFSVYAMLDLCKLGYQDDALNRLQTKSHAQARAKIKTDVHYFYGEDGNLAIKEDRYSDGLWPMPIKEVLAAMKKSLIKNDPYRRLVWAIALLEAMQDDGEDLRVLFYGH